MIKPFCLSNRVFASTFTLFSHLRFTTRRYVKPRVSIMTSTAFVQKLRECLQAFRTAERGHVAVTFTLAVIPIIGFIGSAVDYSRANMEIGRAHV